MYTSITTRRSARLQGKEATSFGRRTAYLRRGKRLYKKTSSQSLDVTLDTVKKLPQEFPQEHFGVSPDSPQKKVKKEVSSESPSTEVSDLQKTENEVSSQTEEQPSTDFPLKTPFVKRVVRRSPPPAPRRSSRVAPDDIWNPNGSFNISTASTDDPDNVTPKSRSWRRSKLSDFSSVMDKRRSTVDASCQTDTVKIERIESREKIVQLTERIIQDNNPQVVPENKGQNIVMGTAVHPVQERPRTAWTLASFDEDPLGRILMPAVAEFLGTLLYVLITDLLGTAGNTPTSRVGISLFDGATLAALVIIFAPFGGGHFSPSVTMGAMLTLNTRWLVGAAIIFCQIFGGFFGALLARATLRSSAFVDLFSSLGVIQFQNEYPPPVDEEDFVQFANRFQIYFLDSMLCTFIVLSVVLTVNDNPPSNVGFSVGIAKAVTGYISFQSIGQSGNFARLVANDAIASIFLMDDKVWRLFYLFFFSSITGPILAAIFYWALNTTRLPRLDVTRPIDREPVIPQS
ncbi:hypothetical protein FO519_006125 [Halicephalobus sp. NKZ332]|nr:hypothetical protein FO519_006125 [Halicephalobus sp. NKZ332]